MLSRIGRPITLWLRFAGSGLFSSVPGGPLVQTMLPHRMFVAAWADGFPGALAHGATRITAVFSATIQSPVGSVAGAPAARAGPPRQPTAVAANQNLRMLFLRVARCKRDRAARPQVRPAAHAVLCDIELARA